MTGDDRPFRNLPPTPQFIALRGVRVGSGRPESRTRRETVAEVLKVLGLTFGLYVLAAALIFGVIGLVVLVVWLAT